MRVILPLALLATTSTAYSAPGLTARSALYQALASQPVARPLGGVSSLVPRALAATATLTGYVFEDVNYGGGLGRPRSAANTSARANARVELYDASGTFLTFATTNANGQYQFSALAAGTYTVRVVNSTVTSSRNTANATGLLAVQTYNGSATRVGGEAPEKVDAGSGAAATTLGSLSTAATATAPGTIAQSQATVVVADGAATTGPDFGFSFDVVVNTNDVATTSGNNAQGSLRQFLLNSDALGGESSLAPVYTATDGTTTALATALETSIFMIPNGAAVAGQRAGLVSGFAAPGTGNGAGAAATIILAANLPLMSGPATALDGSTQTRSTGDSNAAVATSGSESTGPEVLLNANNKVTSGNGVVCIAASSLGSQVVSLGIYGSNYADKGIGIEVVKSATGIRIRNCTINNNGANISFAASTATTPSAATITGNILRDSQRPNADGIELNGYNSNMTITGNQLLRNAGFGIDFVMGANTGNVITDNLFSGNGAGGTDQLSGIGLRGAGSNRNTIAHNTFTNNHGAGIIAKPGTTGNIFSQNSFAGNGTTSDAGLGLAIDLTAMTTNNGDGVTLNDAGDTDGYDTTKNPATTGGNALLNFPVLQTAVLAGGTLTLKGYARPNEVVELYLAAPDPTHFGEGQTYLTSFTQAAAAGTTGNVVTGTATTYSGTQPDSLNQGTDTTTPFTFTYTPTAAQLAQLQATTVALTATATLTAADGAGDFGTSEFSGLVRVLQNPVPDNATNTAVAPNTASPVALNPSLSAMASGYASDVTTTTANTIGSYTVGPATNGTLYYNGAALTAATVVTDATQLTFLPAAGFTGNATFPYTATDANGQASTLHKTGSTTAAGAATYTIPVAAPLPVVLVRFEAVPSLATAVLTWQTASEINNQYFAIERSPDGAVFGAIGQVAGHHSVATAQQYRFVDAGAGSLGQPLVYYRLRQVNYDGTSSYSPVQVVRFAADGPPPAATLTIAPNPVAGTLHAQLPSAGAQCLVYNLLGQLLQRAYTATQEAAIDLPNLPAGTYVLVVQPEQGTPLQRRFSKQ